MAQKPDRQMAFNPSGALGTGPVKAVTLVDQVMDAIVARAAMGIISPGARINELELSKEFQVSRAPLREALRMLVAYGVAENTPYQGMRLVSLTLERLKNVNEVRLELEKLAVRGLSKKAIADLLVELRGINKEIKAAAQRDDRFEVASLDVTFHRRIIAASHNPVLINMWQMLDRQLLIFFGYGARLKTLRSIVTEHETLVEVFESGDLEKIYELLAEHIISDNVAIATQMSAAS